MIVGGRRRSSEVVGVVAPVGAGPALAGAEPLPSVLRRGGSHLVKRGGLRGRSSHELGRLRPKTLIRCISDGRQSSASGV